MNQLQQIEQILDPILDEFPEHNRNDEHEALRAKLALAILPLIPQDTEPEIVPIANLTAHLFINAVYQYNKSQNQRNPENQSVVVKNIKTNAEVTLYEISKGSKRALFHVGILYSELVRDFFVRSRTPLLDSEKFLSILNAGTNDSTTADNS